MKNWERAEKIVKNLSGGYATIGSGNKHQEGDVAAYGHHIEVKQSDKSTMAIQMQWFKTIERNYEENDVDGILVIFLRGLEGYCYVLDRKRTNEPYKKWTSKKYSGDELPEFIMTEKYVWALQPLNFLTLIAKEETYKDRQKKKEEDDDV